MRERLLTVSAVGKGTDFIRAAEDGFTHLPLL